MNIDGVKFEWTNLVETSFAIFIKLHFFDVSNNIKAVSLFVIKMTSQMRYTSELLHYIYFIYLFYFQFILR